MLGAQLRGREQRYPLSFHSPHYAREGLGSDWEPAQKFPWLRGSLVIHVSRLACGMYSSLYSLMLDMCLGMTQTKELLWNFAFLSPFAFSCCWACWRPADSTCFRDNRTSVLLRFSQMYSGNQEWGYFWELQPYFASWFSNFSSVSNLSWSQHADINLSVCPLLSYMSHFCSVKYTIVPFSRWHPSTTCFHKFDVEWNRGIPVLFKWWLMTETISVIVSQHRSAVNWWELPSLKWKTHLQGSLRSFL